MVECNLYQSHGNSFAENCRMRMPGGLLSGSREGEPRRQPCSEPRELNVSSPLSPGAAVAGIYRVAGKNMAPLEALVWGVGQTVLTLIISFSRILATL